MKLELKKFDEDNAADYTAHVRNAGDSVYHHYYEKPAMYELLPTDMTGMNAVSLGCGSGEDCEEPRRRGAVVSGIDISSGLIEEAKKAYPKNTYHVGSMDELSMFADAKLDLAYSSLAVHYLDNWTKFFREVNRILKPGGRFIFSMAHPFAAGSNKFDSSDNVQIKGIARVKYADKPAEFVGDYFSHEPKQNSFSMDGVVTFQKTLSDVSLYANQFSFLLNGIYEPLPLVEMETIRPSDYAALSKQPYFIIYDLVKNPS